MSNQQMHRKTASLNSPVSCKEKPDRVEEPPDYSAIPLSQCGSLSQVR
uniref:GRAM domain containing 2A n=1 Tax=Homo sapiens TaxID=9606 RepID=H3BTF7_HUMAN